MNVPAMASLMNLPERERVGAIGELAMMGQVVAFVVDDEAAAVRYLRALKVRFPKVGMIYIGSCPIPDKLGIKVRGPMPAAANCGILLGDG